MRPRPPDAAAAARALVGVPFRLHGRDERGLDCAGLVWLAARRAGAALPDGHDYDALPLLQAVVSRLARILPPAPPGIANGDLAVFSFARRHAHLGIVSAPMAGRLGVIHAYAPLGRVVEHGLDARWRRRLVRRFTFIDQSGG